MQGERCFPETLGLRLALFGQRAQLRAMSDAIYARAASLDEAEIDEEIVGLDRAQGEVFGFNRVASDVWRLLEEPLSADQLNSALREKYDVPPDQCRAEIDALLEELVEMKLVTRIPAA